MDLGALPGYRDLIARQYDAIYATLTPESARARHTALAPYLTRVLPALELPDEGYHLDLGCGDGLCALAVARLRPEMTVVGLDASERAIHLARALAREDGLTNAHFAVADAEAPPEGQSERLSALSSFNLLADKHAALTAWRKRATAEARLVLTDAFATLGPGTQGAGATSLDGLAQAARVSGWRIVHREDLTPLIKKLHEARAWYWPEYLRDGFRYALVAMERK